MSNGDLEQKVASRWDAGRGNLENFASCFNYIFRGSCCSLKKHLKLSKRKFFWPWPPQCSVSLDEFYYHLKIIYDKKNIIKLCLDYNIGTRSQNCRAFEDFINFGLFETAIDYCQKNQECLGIKQSSSCHNPPNCYLPCQVWKSSSFTATHYYKSKF